MEALPEEVKLYIVQQLACYRGYSEVARSVKAEYDLEVTRQHVRYYDPEAANPVPPAKKWRKVFESTRAGFQSDLARVGITHATRRAELLEAALTLAMKRGQLAIALQILDRAERLFGVARPAGESDASLEDPDEVLPDPDGEPVDYMERVIGRDLAVAPPTSGPFGRRA